MQRVSGLKQQLPQVLANPLLIFLVLEANRLSFKLFSPLPRFSWGCARALLLSNYFPGCFDIWGPYPTLSNPFPRFPQARLSIMVTMCIPAAHASQFCLIIWLLLASAQQKNFPLGPSWFLLHMYPAMNFFLTVYHPLSLPQSQANTSCFWDDWKASPSSRGRKGH